MLLLFGYVPTFISLGHICRRFVNMRTVGRGLKWGAPIARFIPTQTSQNYLIQHVEAMRVPLNPAPKISRDIVQIVISEFLMTIHLPFKLDVRPKK